MHYMALAYYRMAFCPKLYVKKLSFNARNIS